NTSWHWESTSSTRVQSRCPLHSHSRWQSTGMAGEHIHVRSSECQQKSGHTAGDVAIQAPGRLAVIEACPGRSYRDLVRILRLHRLIEPVQIISSPVAAIGREPFPSRIHPGVETVERIGIRSGTEHVDE